MKKIRKAAIAVPVAAYLIVIFIVLAAGWNKGEQTGTVLMGVPTEAVTSTPEPTAEPEPTALPEAPATPEPKPTEVPHEHTWVTKETPATCTEEGFTWEECECGAKQNEEVLPAKNHGNLIYKVVKEATADEDGSFEESCEICGVVIYTGTIVKLVPTEAPKPTEAPTPEPTAVPTAKPTETPKPTAAPVPTATPVPEEPYLYWSALKSDSIHLDTESKLTANIEVGNVEYLDQLPDGLPVFDIPTYMVVESSNISVLEIKADSPLWGGDRITFIPVSAGEATVTITLYAADKHGNRLDKVYDTLKLSVTVEEFETKVDFSDSDYNPAENGYPELAGEWQCGDHAYAQIWGNGEKEVKKKDAVLVVTGTGVMWSSEELSAQGIERQYGNYSSNITKAYINEGITRIEGVSHYSKMTSVSLPSTLKEIGPYCFYNDIKLEELYLPEGLEWIGEHAFYRLKELTEIKIPSTVKYIGGGAFMIDAGKNKVKSVVIPKSVEYIGYGVFWHRYDLVIEIILEDGTDTSGYEAGWDELYW